MWYIIRKVFASREASWVGKIVCRRRLEKEEVGSRKWKKAKSLDWANLLILDPKRKSPTATAQQHVPEVSLIGSISKTIH